MPDRDYSAGKIYCIRNRAAGDGIVYIGSTVQKLCERMRGHRKDIKRRPTYKLYKLMNEVGIEHFHIELVTTFPCESKPELEREEGRYHRLHRPECNARIAGRTHVEWVEDNQVAHAAQRKAHYEANKETRATYAKQHREANKDAITAYKKEHREANKDAYAARDKAKYEANKEAVAARTKAYNEANKEAILARRKAYYEANKDAILARAKARREAAKAQ